jgi:mRNA-degrading endonuclease RelE of RelBE toxin-antitoxin system
MSYSVIPTPEFGRLFKKLAKKYPSLRSDLEKLIKRLSENPDSGTSLGHNLYKIRMAISSKGRGKSGGARIITYLVTDDRELYLIHIYDKGQLDTLKRDQILELLKNTGLI